VGHVHHAPGAIPDDHVAEHLPALSDRDVGRLVSLAGAYTDVRGVLVAMAGLSVLQTTGLQGGGDVESVLAGLTDHLADARVKLASAGGSADPRVRARLHAVRRAAGLLGEELEQTRKRPTAPLSQQQLGAAHALLRGSALPEAGMRELSSTSCASWHSH